MSDAIAESNRLRIEIWGLNEELAMALAPDPEYRNRDKIERIEAQIMDRERQIAELREE